jgi:hypothetical protein
MKTNKKKKVNFDSLPVGERFRWGNTLWRKYSPTRGVSVFSPKTRRKRFGKSETVYKLSSKDQ